jgi:hypothetical protein
VRTRSWSSLPAPHILRHLQEERSSYLCSTGDRWDSYNVVCPLPGQFRMRFRDGCPAGHREASHCDPWGPAQRLVRLRVWGVQAHPAGTAGPREIVSQNTRKCSVCQSRCTSSPERTQKSPAGSHRPFSMGVGSMCPDQLFQCAGHMAWAPWGGTHLSQT